ncbi:acylphosphatase [Aquimarina rubra]|uniref:acylphosphatase n=1 Tax=Aquimarina rubra TaxID=1920033 RepID=A0ABW5LHQ6_9FLAO
MLKHYNISVKGKVQGVWYRKSTWEKAMELGVKGTVKNQFDGSVYIEAEGEENQLKVFIEWCAKGPEFAEVSDISFEEADPSFYQYFEILY